MQDFELARQLAQQRMAQYGQQARSFQAPQGQMVSGHYVAPNVFQYLAEGLRGIGGMRGEQMAQQELKDLDEKQRTATAQALRQFGQLSQGNPEQMPQDGMGPPEPARKPDLRAAYQALMSAPDTRLQQMGMQGTMQIPEMEAKQADRLAQREFQTQQAQQAAEQRVEQLQLAHQQRMEMMREQNASREQMARDQREFQRQMKEQFGAMNAAQPYYQPVQTAQGIMSFNARTGRMEPVMGSSGQPVVGAANDPALQATLAGAKAGATVTAKDRAERIAEAPQAIAQGEETIRLVDDLLKAPGFGQAVGLSRLAQVQRIPGTAAKDFDIRLDQLKGQQFLQAFESLKGGGQITEVEGKKATDAIARMDAAGSEQEFIKAAKEFQSVIRTGVERARSRVGGQAQPSAPVGQTVTVGGQTYTRPAGMTDAQWSAYKQAVGAR